jgi:3-oxoacyl-[acyl-carrier protein] reductase
MAWSRLAGEGDVDMRDLSGQVAIVTGSAQGIGRAIAEVLAAEGASTVIADLNVGAAEATAAEITASGHTAIGVALDVTDRASAGAMADAAVDQLGRIDILAANAGIYPEAELESIHSEQWDLTMNINAKGALHTIQACLPQMREQRYGRIVLTSSITGPVTGIPGFAHYGASKAAMIGLMHSAAIEVARHGITINAVLPGNIETPGLADLGPEHIRAMRAAIPGGELGQASDIGWAVRFLASPEARFITGHSLVVDGGQVLPESGEAIPR